MSFEPKPLSEQEQRAVLSVCILAAFADGAQDEVERSQIESIVNRFSGEHIDLAAAYQEVLGGTVSVNKLAPQLSTPAAKALAFEMAVCVCHADGDLNDGEKRFLAELRQGLELDATGADTHQQTAQAMTSQPMTVASPPVMDPARDADLDRMILNASILNGALELIPHTLATMAIVPLQMRIVYQIGKRFGFDLDKGHIRDFLATVGIGLTSQVFEGFARRLVGGLTRGLAGRLVGSLAGQATGSAFAFATTYALGQAAKRYYASGRTLTQAQLKDVFASMVDSARSIQGRYSDDMARKAQQVNVNDLLPLVRQQG